MGILDFFNDPSLIIRFVAGFLRFSSTLCPTILDRLLMLDSKFTAGISSGLIVIILYPWTVTICVVTPGWVLSNVNVYLSGVSSFTFS